MLQIVDVAAIQVLEETEETADVDLALAMDAVDADVAVTTAVSGLSCF